MWLLPSRGRPEKMKALAEHENMQHVPLMVYLSIDDERLAEYKEITYPNTWDIIYNEGLKLAEIWNWAYRNFPDEKFYGFIGDDCVPEPKTWNTTLEDAAGDWNIAYPNDGVHGQNLCTHPCVGGALLRALGWWALPGVKHSFVDTALMVIGQNTGRLKYVPEVLFDHQHPVKLGPRAIDKTYERGQESYARDEATFNRWFRGHKAKFDVRRVLRRMAEQKIQLELV